MKTIESGMEIALAELPVGMSAKVIALGENLRGRKKFADLGVVPGMILAMQSHAPLGSLLRIKILGSTIALHSKEGKNIRVRAY